MSTDRVIGDNPFARLAEPIRRAQAVNRIASRIGELSVDLIGADEGPERHKIANELRALADQIEAA